MAADTPALEVSGLSRSFGALVVTDAVDMTLMPGDRRALIGPNGAGKTTFVNLVTGTLTPSSGTIRLAGEDVTATRPAQRVKRGLVRTFQVNQLLGSFSVIEHVLLAVLERRGHGGRIVGSLWRRNEEIDEACEVLERLGLHDHAASPIAELSYGRRRLVELAIALALRPRVLLLDEPAAGIPKGESGLILDVIGALPADVAVLMIEHDMEMVFRFAREVTVLVQGRVLMTASPAEVSDSAEVRSIYLGERHHG